MSSHPESIGYQTKEKYIIRTSLFRRMFPRLPSAKELAFRKEENVRQIVTTYLGGGAVRGYLTEEDINDRRNAVLRRR